VSGEEPNGDSGDHTDRHGANHETVFGGLSVHDRFSFGCELALAIEVDPNDLLEFGQSMLSIHEGLEVLKLKSSPRPLGFNQIEKPCFARTIPDARCFQALLGLWQDGGAV
jgi:hypothetical protein